MEASFCIGYCVINVKVLKSIRQGREDRRVLIAAYLQA